jgi:hypothetical protein
MTMAFFCLSFVDIVCLRRRIEEECCAVQDWQWEFCFHMLVVGSDSSVSRRSE